MAPQPSSFALLVKRYRQARGWTQDDLARHAGVSMRTISDIERGLSRSPHRDTVQLLSAALGLRSHDAAEFSAVSRGQSDRGAEQPAITRLPLPTSSLLGRDDDIAAALRVLASPAARLLTLVGSGGIGKTRLALAIATALISQYHADIYFVDCAQATQPEQVRVALAHVLDAREGIDISLAAAIDANLADRDLLVVFDNFEQVTAATSDILDLLAKHPRLRGIVTSRVPLKVAVERVQTVAALPVPDAYRQLPETISTYPSVALFVERARAALPDFTLTAANAATVARICARLSGIPLAIELAASQVRRLSLPEIVAQLSQQSGMTLLGTRASHAEGRPKRQQSLEDVFDWSYRLLDAPIQILFRRLCVFSGDFDLDAVAGICDPHAALGIDYADSVAALVEHHLVRALPIADTTLPPRFVLLDIVRAFGVQLLVQRGELPQLRRQHAAYYADHLKYLEAAFVGKGQGDALAQCTRDYDNIQAALRWARERQDVDLGLRLVAPLWWYWEKRHTLSEGREWLEGMIALYRPGRHMVDPLTMSRVLYGAAILATTQGDLDSAGQLGERCLTWCEQTGEQEKIGQARALLGSINRSLGNTAAALAYFTAARAIFEHIDVPRLEMGVLNNLSAIAIDAGDTAQAATLLAASLALKRRLGDQRGIAVGLVNLSELQKQQESYAAALASAEEAGAIFTVLDDQMGLAMALNNQGEIALAQGDATAALTHLRAGLSLFQKSDNRAGGALVWANIGDAYAHSGQMSEAASAWRASLETSAVGSPAEHALTQLARVAEMRAETELAAYLRGAAGQPDDVAGAEIYAVAFAAGQRATPAEVLHRVIDAFLVVAAP